LYVASTVVVTAIRSAWTSNATLAAVMGIG